MAPDENGQKYRQMIYEKREKLIPDMYCLESVTDRLLLLAERLPAATRWSQSSRLRFERCEELPLSSQLRSKRKHFTLPALHVGTQ